MSGFYKSSFTNGKKKKINKKVALYTCMFISIAKEHGFPSLTRIKDAKFTNVTK